MNAPKSTKWTTTRFECPAIPRRERAFHDVWCGVTKLERFGFTEAEIIDAVEAVLATLRRDGIPPWE